MWANKSHLVAISCDIHAQKGDNENVGSVKFAVKKGYIYIFFSMLAVTFFNTYI